MVFRSIKYKGPDYLKNKRILDKINHIDANFLTTSPDDEILPKNKLNLFIPNPCDQSFETLNNYERVGYDVFCHQSWSSQREFKIQKN